MKKWRVGCSALLFVVAYAGLAYLVPQRTLMQILNIGVLSISVAVVSTYAPAWIMTLRKHTLDGPEMLSLGIGCTWTAEIGQRVWSIAWRGLSQPDWMTHSFVLPFFLALTVMGGIQHITAPGAVNGIIPKRSWITVGITLGLVTLVLLTATWLGYGPRQASGWLGLQSIVAG